MKRNATLARERKRKEKEARERKQAGGSSAGGSSAGKRPAGSSSAGSSSAGKRPAGSSSGGSSMGGGSSAGGSSAGKRPASSSSADSSSAGKRPASSSLAGGRALFKTTFERSKLDFLSEFRSNANADLSNVMTRVYVAPRDTKFPDFYRGDDDHALADTGSKQESAYYGWEPLDGDFLKKQGPIYKSNNMKMILVVVQPKYSKPPKGLDSVLAFAYGHITFNKGEGRNKSSQVTLVRASKVTSEINGVILNKQVDTGERWDFEKNGETFTLKREWYLNPTNDKKIDQPGQNIFGVPNPHIVLAIWKFLKVAGNHLNKSSKQLKGLPVNLENIEVDADPDAACAQMYHTDYPKKNKREYWFKHQAKLEVIYATLGFTFKKGENKSWGPVIPAGTGLSALPEDEGELQERIQRGTIPEDLEMR